MKKGERPSTLREVLRALVIALLIITGVISLLGASLFVYVLISKQVISVGLGTVDVGIGPSGFNSRGQTHFGQLPIATTPWQARDYCAEPALNEFTLWEVTYRVLTCKKWERNPAALLPPVPTFPAPLPPVGPGTVPVPYPVRTAAPPALPVPTR